MLFLILFIAACTNVQVQKFDRAKAFPPTNAADVVIYPDKPEERQFIELGEITVTGADNWPQIEKVFRKKAAEMGADGVYVFTKQQETRQYVSHNDCDIREGYYYPYHHFGWNEYGRPGYYYPRGYYYCYGYRPTVDTAMYVSAVGIAIKFKDRIEQER